LKGFLLLARHQEIDLAFALWIIQFWLDLAMRVLQVLQVQKRHSGRIPWLHLLIPDQPLEE
jgi:hypothetical protein